MPELLPNPPASSEQLDAVRASTVKHGVARMTRLSPSVDATALDRLLAWADDSEWRSRSAAKFWIHVHMLLIRWGEAAHAAHLEQAPDYIVDADMHHWLLRVRAFSAEAIRARLSPGERDTDLGAAFPRKKADQLAHIRARLGDPRWAPGDPLVKALAKARTLETEEGLGLWTAALLHLEGEDLRDLVEPAARQPMLQVLLAAKGIAVRDLEAERSALLEAVAAAPFDDAPRLVLADWLLEEGEPWGAHLQAALRGHPTQPDWKKLIAWTGPLSEVLETKAEWRDYDTSQSARVPIYDRGMLSGCCVRSLDGTVAGTPEWATIRFLDVRKSITSIDAYRLPSLAVLGGLSAGELPTLSASSVASQIQGIGLHKARKKEQQGLWDQLLQLENLRFLHFYQWWNEEALVDHPLLERIEVLFVPSHSRPSPARDAIRDVVPEVVEWPWEDGALLQSHDLLLRRLSP